jgi:hypothetical protein
METIQTLSLALGTAWTSGINLYATVAVLGLIQRFGLATLPGGLDTLDNPWIIGTALFLYAVEFIADKVPYFDSIWDAVHTFIRVPAGAVLAFAGSSAIDQRVQIVALLVGGGLALSSHGTKATVRAAVNTSPEPFTNWTLSIVEDIFAIGATVLAVLHPLILVAIIIIFLLILAWILPKVIRRIGRMVTSVRNIFKRRPVSQPI